MKTRAKAPAARSLLGKLASLREQTGNGIGELYARTAGTLLKRLEAIEDRAAQRRSRRHGKPTSASPSLTPSGASEVQSRPFTPETSV